MLVAFFIVQWSMDVNVKYVVIVALTTLLTIAVYEVVVKRLNVLRFLFGMKPIARTSSPAPVPGNVVPHP